MMAGPREVPVDPERDAQFDKAFALLTELVDFEEVQRQFPVRENAVYTVSLTLWMLVYQRMCPDASLEAAVKKMIQSKPSFLPDNKRVREGTLSSNTSTYSQARSRLPREAVEWLAQEVSQSLIQAARPSLGDRRVFVIDGTTITLAPETKLRERFPPASDKHVWPVALLTVAHELASGAALIPEVGAMYGEQAVSETQQISGLLKQMPPGSVVMGDVAFGIFGVAHAVASAGHSFLFRLNKQRFQSLQKKARLISSQEDPLPVWSLTWQPTKDNLSTNSDLPREAALEVRLHEIVIHEELTLWLVTDLADDSQTLSDLYHHRGDVEIDIRNLKVVLDTENIRARSEPLFFKELLMSIVSYNLVTQFRRQAAALIKQPPRRMSFKRTWTTFREFLLSAMYTEPVGWRNQYVRALSYAMLDKLPLRPGRSYEREAYRWTPKCNNFKRREPPPHE